MNLIFDTLLLPSNNQNYNKLSVYAEDETFFTLYKTENVAASLQCKEIIKQKAPSQHRLRRGFGFDYTALCQGSPFIILLLLHSLSADTCSTGVFSL